MSHTDHELNKSFNKAKVELIKRADFTFMATLFFSLKHLWDNSVPTAYTDGLSIGMNEHFFMAQDPMVRVSVLAHETWHVAFKHMLRSQEMNYNPQKFNMAADYVINLMIKDAGLPVPDTWLCDEKYRGMSTEQIYKLLPDPPPQQPQSGNGGRGDSPGDDLKSPSSNSGNQQNNSQGNQPQSSSGGTAPTKEEISHKIDQAILKAHTQAQMKGQAGSIPGDIQIAIDNLLNPKLDWRTILQNYMNKFVKEDYTWSKPNMLYFHQDIYLPAQHSEAMGEVAIAVDTSGSVSEEEFRAFLTEITDIKEKLNPSLTTIIDFDTSIKHVHKIAQEDDSSIKSLPFSGRGGTNLTPVFNYYEKTKPEVLIVFSDLYCNKIQDDPGYDVIWVCVDNPNAEVNFGQLIHYDTSTIAA